MLLLIKHRGIINRQGFSCWNIDRVPTFFTAQHFILNADIGKSASHHHLMVPTSRPVRVKVFGFNPLFLQIASCGAVFLDITRWGNMIGGDRVSKHSQNTCLFNVGNRFRWLTNLFKKWRMANIG